MGENTNCHRFILTREWLGSGGTINWIMLNPSTADEKFDDPTIRKCIGFSKRWGFRRLSVTNLYAFRSTEPRDLRALLKTDITRAIGENNDAEISHAAGCADLTVVAWGAHPFARARIHHVLMGCIPAIETYCIGLTREKFPLHPVMAAYTDKPMRYC